MLGKDGGVIQFGPPLRYSLPVRLVVVPGRDEGFALLAVDPAIVLGIQVLLAPVRDPDDVRAWHGQEYGRVGDVDVLGASLAIIEMSKDYFVFLKKFIIFVCSINAEQTKIQ